MTCWTQKNSKAYSYPHWRYPIFRAFAIFHTPVSTQLRIRCIESVWSSIYWCKDSLNVSADSPCMNLWSQPVLALKSSGDWSGYICWNIGLAFSMTTAPLRGLPLCHSCVNQRCMALSNWSASALLTMQCFLKLLSNFAPRFLYISYCGFSYAIFRSNSCIRNTLIFCSMDKVTHFLLCMICLSSSCDQILVVWCLYLWSPTVSSSFGKREVFIPSTQKTDRSSCSGNLQR